MKKIISFLISPFFVIVLIAITVRVDYFFHDARANFLPDSYGYFSRAVKLKTGNPMLILFSDERVPLYPLIISAVANPKKLLIQSDITQSFAGDKTLILINIVSGIGTLFFVMSTLMMIGASPFLLYILGFIVATNGALLYWEHTVSPESLAIFGFTAFVYIAIAYIKKHKPSSVVFLWMLAVLLFLLKPQFVLLPVIVFFFLLVSHPPKKQKLLLILSIISYVAVIFGYIQGNKYFHGYGGINHSGDVNLLGRIMQFQLPVDENINPFFSSKLIEYQQLGLEVMPYRFLEWSDPAIYGTGWLLEDLRVFVNDTVIHNIPLYLRLAIPDTIPALTTYHIANSSYIENYPLLASILMPVSKVIRFSCLLLLFFTPMYGIAWCINFFKKNGMQIRYAQIFCIAGSACYTVCMAIFGSYGEFGRLTTPALPLTFAVVGIGITDIIQYIRKKKYN